MATATTHNVGSAEEVFGSLDHNLAEAMYAMNRADFDTDDEFVAETILFIREQIVNLRLHLDPTLNL